MGSLLLSTSGGEHKDVAILYLPDIFGIWQNSKLMADQFAACGYHCLVADTFNGDATTEGSNGKNPHTKEVDPIVEAAIQFLKQEYGVAKIGAVGYCFGGKYVVRHYKSGIDVGLIAHPAGVEKEELAAIQGPLSIAATETDSIFPAEKRHQTEAILAKRGVYAIRRIIKPCFLLSSVQFQSLDNSSGSLSIIRSLALFNKIKNPNSHNHLENKISAYNLSGLAQR
ncbi:hypothetical protein FSARC_14709 [Fusarium sarcochroum]|uniref:Dienelactone hydrolase domain-containing protein n=1 Tax=Fusarium sarcochroum TaxID=1208366 RepID=A0A8H4SRF1_9HYPO|nr:hypothetical protein FSARC_14709 [Fusarium sarcochroum]